MLMLARHDGRTGIVSVRKRLQDLFSVDTTSKTAVLSRGRVGCWAGRPQLLRSLLLEVCNLCVVAQLFCSEGSNLLE
jgi:hypothetical protein